MLIPTAEKGSFDFSKLLTDARVDIATFCLDEAAPAFDGIVRQQYDLLSALAGSCRSRALIEDKTVIRRMQVDRNG
jgi:hypothetical protein